MSTKRRGLSRKMAFNTLLLATTAIGAAFTTPALAQDSEGGLDDIIITGTKREENLQDVPISVQALGEERLEQLGITDFADYAQHLPTLSYAASYGPGYNRPFMRGVASGENGNHSGSMPSVGTYLDEQPITTIVGNLDLRLYDISRVEVLAGPQGTLYGASSQAGTVRIITNRPDTSGFSASYDLEVNTMPEGDWGQSVAGYVNIPLGDRAAVRIVAWQEHAGGYIDNVEGTRLYPESGVLDENSDVAEDDYNDVDTIGARVALGIDLNENWTITPQIMGQAQESNGIFAEQQSQGDLEVMHWFPEWNEDTWIQGALTVEGQISNFDITFAASRLERDVDSNQDYADYGYFYDTYLGSGAYFTDSAFNVINPAQQVEGRDSYNRDTYELRMASPAENPLRFILGAFYQHSEHRIHQRYIIEDFNDAHEVTGWPDTIWLTEQLRTDEETALFGEVAFDFTPNLTATLGMRAFQTENSLRGYFGFNDTFAAFYGLAPDYPGEQTCIGPASVGNEPCTNLDKSTEEDGELYRANLTYRIDDDRMIYATYSEGFRPGGINRRGTLPPYASDFLDNYEIGWKTEWANGRLRWNGAAFLEVWEDFQFAFLGLNGLTEIQNAGDAEIRGVETDLTWAPTDNLTINAAATWLDSELTSADIADTVSGTALPVAPELKLDFGARYEFPFFSWQGFAQGNASYVGERSVDIRQTEAGLIGTLPEYWLVDVSVGFEAENYNLSLFIDNLFDERAITGRYTECAITTCFGEQYDVVARPMMIGLRFGQSF
ncbi:TonB-dependent receptor [Vitreimonas flagellata]|uniref:TonB-dependent receptor n=1 Tax=Vitreimonas flagellata TaxID=2560861 RepID=UPI001074F9D2|nr:TonB-dependent receptor [Vitreimonas flagellata]